MQVFYGGRLKDGFLKHLDSLGGLARREQHDSPCVEHVGVGTQFLDRFLHQRLRLGRRLRTGQVEGQIVGHHGGLHRGEILAGKDGAVDGDDIVVAASVALEVRFKHGKRHRSGILAPGLGKPLLDTFALLQ